MPGKTVSVPALLAAVVLVAAIPVRGATLRDAVEQAILTNPEIGASMNRRFAAEEAVSAARGGYFPRIDVNLGAGREKLDDLNSRFLGLANTTFARHEASVTLTQMLFDGFGVRSQVAQQKAQTDSLASGVATTAEDLGLRTIGTYLEVLRRRETVDEATDSLEAHRRIHTRIGRLSESGVGRRADLNQAESRLALANANLRQEQASLADAEISYVRLVGAQPDALAIPVLPESTLPQTQALALEAALDGHPALKSARFDVDAASAANTAAKAVLSPRLDLDLSANRINQLIDGVTVDRSVMLRLRFNIFHGGAEVAQVGQTAFRLAEARDNLERTRRQVQEGILQSWSAYLAARDRLGPLTEYVEASAATRDAYAKQFSIGQRSLLDLLTAEGEYYNARSALTTGQYTRLASGYRILAGMGQLMRSLAIALPAGQLLASGDNR